MKNNLFIYLILFFATYVGISQTDTPSNFWVSGQLNTTSYPRGGNVYGNLGPTLTIDKQYRQSVIEVTVNTSAKVENFSGEAKKASFQVRIDGIYAPIGNNVVIHKDEGTGYISIFAVFQNLRTGSHTIQLYGKPIPAGNFWVTLDPGGFGGRIIAKETF